MKNTIGKSMNPSSKDCFPAFPPPRKIICESMPSNFSSIVNGSHVIINDPNILQYNPCIEPKEIVYPYFPSHESIEKTFDVNQLYDNGRQNYNYSPVQASVEQTSGVSIGQNSNIEQFKKTYNLMENMSLKIDEFLRNTNKRFNEKVLQQYECCKPRHPESSTDERKHPSFHRRLSSNRKTYFDKQNSNNRNNTSKSKQCNDFNKPKYGKRNIITRKYDKRGNTSKMNKYDGFDKSKKYDNKYKIDRQNKVSEEEPLRKFINESFDSILAKAISDVENRKKAEEGNTLPLQAMPTSTEYSQHTDKSVNLTTYSSTYPKNELLYNKQSTFREETNTGNLVDDNVYSGASMVSKLGNTAMAKENFSQKKPYADSSFNLDRVSSVMKGNIAEEILQFFTEEKLNDLANIVIQKNNSYEQGNESHQSLYSNQASDIYALEQAPYNSNISSNMNYYYTATDDQFIPRGKLVNKSLDGSSTQTNESETDMSEYSTDMDISPTSSTEHDETSRTPNVKNIRSKNINDNGNVHHYSSPEEASDYSPPKPDYSSSYFSKNFNFNFCPEKYAISQKHETLANTRRSPSHYDMNIKSNISQQQSTLVSSSYKNKYSPCRDSYYDRNMVSLRKQMSQSENLHGNDSITNTKFSANHVYNKSLTYGQMGSEHSRYKSLEISLRGNSSSQRSPRYRKDTPTRRDNEHLIHELHFSPKRYSTSHDRAYLHSPRRLSASHDKISRHSPRRNSNSHDRSNRYSPRRYGSSHDRINRHSPRRYDSSRDRINRHSPRRYGSSRDRINRHSPRHRRELSPHSKGSHSSSVRCKLSPIYSKRFSPTGKRYKKKQFESCMVSEQDLPQNLIKKQLVKSDIKSTSTVKQKLGEDHKPINKDKTIDMPKIYELLKNQEYEAFADEYLRELSSNQQNNKNTIPSTRLGVHERLGPLCNEATTKTSDHSENYDYHNLKGNRIVTYAGSTSCEEGRLIDDRRITENSNFSEEDGLKYIKRTITNSNKGYHSPFNSERKLVFW